MIIINKEIGDMDAKELARHISNKLMARNEIMERALQKIRERQGDILGPKINKNGDLIWRWANDAIND